MQSVHSADDPAPKAVEYFPESHIRHAELLEAPTSGEKYPGLHFTQSELFDLLNVPGSQVEHEDDPPVENTPPEHSVHTDAATVLEYMPAGHRAQSLLSIDEEKVPAMQTRQAEEPLAEYVPAKHSIHVLGPTAAIFVEYRPELHSRHSEAPRPANLPAAHKRQTLDAALVA